MSCNSSFSAVRPMATLQYCATFVRSHASSDGNCVVSAKWPASSLPSGRKFLFPFSHFAPGIRPPSDAPAPRKGMTLPLFSLSRRKGYGGNSSLIDYVRDLSKRPKCVRKSGAGDGTRTHNFQLGKLTLYH